MPGIPAAKQRYRAIIVLAGLGQLRHHLGGAHDLHELLPERPGLGSFLRAEIADRLEVKQCVGLTLLTGSLLQRNLCDHAADRRQSTQQAGGVFQKPGLAGHGNTHQQRNDAVGPEQKQQHRFFTGFGIAAPVFGPKFVIGAKSTGFAEILSAHLPNHAYS